MDKNLNENKSLDFVVCPGCGTLNSMENNQCTKCSYKLKTWTSYDAKDDSKTNVIKRPIEKTKIEEENKQVDITASTMVNKKPETLIGILLIMPLYMAFFVIVNILKLGFNIDPYIILPILMYLPIIIGLIMSYKYYKEKASKALSFTIVVFMFLSLFNFFNTYFVEHSGWEGLTPFFGWLAFTIITKILACVYYGSLVGKKKGFTFFALYVIIIVLSVMLGFWA